MTLRKIDSKMINLDLSSFDDIRENVLTVQSRLEDLQRELEGVSQTQLETINERIEELRFQLETNRYVHPPTHPASMIIEDANRRFTTDVEKSGWNKAKTDVVNIQSNIISVENRLATLEQYGGGSNSSVDLISLLREVSYLKLKQEASERIEGGVAFGDDMQGNQFGIEFDSDNSSNIVFRDKKMLLGRDGGNRDVINESYIDITGVTSPVAQSKGGRKMVILDNHQIYIALTASTLKYSIYRSNDYGGTGEHVIDAISTTTITDMALSTDGVDIYTLTSDSKLTFRKLDTENKTWNNVKELTIGGNTLGKFVSIAVNKETKVVHLVYTAKFTSYTSSFNLGYMKGTPNSSGDIEFTAPERLSSANASYTDYEEPNILLTALGNPVIIYTYKKSSSSSDNYVICRFVHDGASWSIRDRGFSDSSKVAIGQPSAIFVPRSVNNLINGRIWVTWAHNVIISNSYRRVIMVTYSDDNGETWSTAQQISAEQNYSLMFPSISANNKNEVTIAYTHPTDSGTYYLKTITTTDGKNWTSESLTNKSAILYSVNTGYTFNLNTIKTPLIYGTNQGVCFSGGFNIPSEIPEANSVAVYKLPKTDYVGLFVKKTGDINIKAYANNNLMSSEFVNEEYQFTKELATEQPVTLKLELSRDNIDGGENDAVTRLLGGIS